MVLRTIVKWRFTEVLLFFREDLETDLNVNIH